MVEGLVFSPPFQGKCLAIQASVVTRLRKMPS